MVDAFKLTVIIPCLNEEANIPLLAKRLLAATDADCLPTEVVFIDDGSNDGTWQAIQQQRAAYGDRVVGVRHGRNLGIPAAWRSGIDVGRGSYACFIDADLQNPPEEVPKLYRRLRESPYDMVQGTRSSIGRLRDSRLLLSRALNMILNRLFGMKSRDNKSGFILGPRRVLDDVLTYRRKYRHFQTFLTVSAKAKGYSVLEVETLFADRFAGTSFLSRAGSAKVSLETLFDLVPAVMEFRLGARPRHGTGLAPKLAAGQSRWRHPYRGWRRVWFELYFATMPLHKWLIRRRARTMYLELKQTEWMSRQDLDLLQLQRLERLIQHAYNHVPYYRRAMREAGVLPEDISDLGDLIRLPLLDKSDVRNNLYFDLFADNHRKRDMLRIATSGSSGEPFTTYGDRHQLEMRFATTLRALEWTGWRFGDRQARLWHQTLGMSWSQVLRERIDAWFMRRLFIPAFELKPANLKAMVKAIERHRPVLVDGYAESLNFLASYVREGGEATFKPRAIMSSAQALPGNVKELIEQEFETTVYDKYGSREFSGIAYQCGHGDDHHVMDESYIVELLVDGRPALPGEIGEVVITDLNNFAVPLIRYRIGDLATAVDQSLPCPCGRKLSRIGPIEGRTQAIVQCGNGVWIPGTFFAHFFKDYEHAVRFFQIHQNQAAAFILRIVKNSQFTEAALAEMLENLRHHVGQETDITVEIVDEIPLLETGKRSPVVSTVKQDFQLIHGPVLRSVP